MGVENKRAALFWQPSENMSQGAMYFRLQGGDVGSSFLSFHTELGTKRPTAQLYDDRRDQYPVNFYTKPTLLNGLQVRNLPLPLPFDKIPLPSK